MAGIAGATATMLVIYIVPNATYLKMKWDATKRKLDGKRTNQYDYQIAMTSNEKEDQRLTVSSAVNEEEGIDAQEEFENRIPPTSFCMYWLIFLGTLLVTSYGIFAFIM